MFVTLSVDADSGRAERDLVRAASMLAQPRGGEALEILVSTEPSGVLEVPDPAGLWLNPSFAGSAPPGVVP